MWEARARLARPSGAGRPGGGEALRLRGGGESSFLLLPALRCPGLRPGKRWGTRKRRPSRLRDFLPCAPSQPGSRDRRHPAQGEEPLGKSLKRGGVFWTDRERGRRNVPLRLWNSRSNFFLRSICSRRSLCSSSVGGGGKGGVMAVGGGNRIKEIC